jgi:hypothetical protein
VGSVSLTEGRQNQASDDKHGPCGQEQSEAEGDAVVPDENAPAGCNASQNEGGKNSPKHARLVTATGNFVARKPRFQLQIMVRNRTLNLSPHRKNFRQKIRPLFLKC